MENPIKMDDLGKKKLVLETPTNHLLALEFSIHFWFWYSFLKLFDTRNLKSTWCTRCRRRGSTVAGAGHGAWRTWAAWAAWHRLHGALNGLTRLPNLPSRDAWIPRASWVLSLSDEMWWDTNRCHIYIYHIHTYIKRIKPKIRGFSFLYLLNLFDLRQKPVSFSTWKAYWISTQGAVAQPVPQAVLAQAVESRLVVELVELLELVAVVEPFVDSLPSSAASRSRKSRFLVDAGWWR